MKYLKLLILLVCASVFASCSDDDNFNTKSATVGFTVDQVTFKENSGLVNIPIEIKGRINGDIKLVVSVSGKGDNPAEENKNYIITDKSLTMLAANDTAATATLNVELTTVDDDVINENREFTLTIASCKGAEVSRKSIDVTLRDNDAAFYEKFFGSWKLEGTLQNSSGTSKISKDIVISGPTDESDKSYNNYLTVSASKMMNVGADLDFTWRFAYTFDKKTKTGTLALVMGEEVSKFGGTYSWSFYSLDDAGARVETPYTTTWSLENGVFPKTISLFPDKAIAFYGGKASGKGTWAYFEFISMTRK